MDFKPRTTKLHNQLDVDKYLARYGVCLYPGIEAEFCPQDTEFMKSPLNVSVYIRPHILALGLKLSLMKFVRGVLNYYRIAPSQLSGVAWHTVRGFEALCDLIVQDACQREVFSVAYVLRKTAQDVRYFVPRVGVKRSLLIWLIVIMACVTLWSW